LAVDDRFGAVIEVERTEVRIHSGLPRVFRRVEPVALLEHVLAAQRRERRAPFESGGEGFGLLERPGCHRFHVACCSYAHSGAPSGSVRLSGFGRMKIGSLQASGGRPDTAATCRRSSARLPTMEDTQ